MIIPCIDLQDGKAVQLVRGSERALSVEDLDALLVSFGPFPLIHVIDLDAAMGCGDNRTIVEKIVASRPARVGGGIRTVEGALELVHAGAEQVIFGTAAFSAGGANIEFLEQVRQAIGRERIVVALDSREGRIVIKGWKESLSIAPKQAIKSLEPYCAAFLCTYVDQEGTMQGTDVELFRALRAATGNHIIAAGGIGSMEQVTELQELGVDVALGMSLYTGAISLQDALAHSRG